MQAGTIMPSLYVAYLMKETVDQPIIERALYIAESLESINHRPSNYSDIFMSLYVSLLGKESPNKLFLRGLVALSRSNANKKLIPYLGITSKLDARNILDKIFIAIPDMTYNHIPSIDYLSFSKNKNVIKIADAIDDIDSYFKLDILAPIQKSIDLIRSEIKVKKEEFKKKKMEEIADSKRLEKERKERAQEEAKAEEARVKKVRAQMIVDSQREARSTIKQTNNQRTLLDYYEEEYQNALTAIDNDVKSLVSQGNDMQAITLFFEKLKKVNNIHNQLTEMYSVIFSSQKILAHYKSIKLAQLGHELIRLTDQSRELADLTGGGIPDELLFENMVTESLSKVGFQVREHPLLNSQVVTEIEYLLDILPLLIEPEYIPFETKDNKDPDNQDRYIPSKVKMCVWRRDNGQCVECGSKEKLEYDHIIPVSKGGSNTERNVQLLCEKCNRQKSASIQ